MQETCILFAPAVWYSPTDAALNPTMGRKCLQFAVTQRTLNVRLEEEEINELKNGEMNERNDTE